MNLTIINNDFYEIYFIKNHYLLFYIFTHITSLLSQLWSPLLLTPGLYRARRICNIIQSRSFNLFEQRDGVVVGDFGINHCYHCLAFPEDPGFFYPLLGFFPKILAFFYPYLSSWLLFLGFCIYWIFDWLAFSLDF